MPNRWPLVEFILILMTKKDTPVRSISPPFDFAERIETAGTSAGSRERGGKRIDFKRAPYFRPLPPRLGDSREEEPLYAYNGGEGEGGRAPRGRSPPPRAPRRALVRSVFAVLRESPPACVGGGEAGERPLARERQQSAKLRREGREGGTAAEFVECLLFSLRLPPGAVK